MAWNVKNDTPMGSTTLSAGLEMPRLVSRLWVKKPKYLKKASTPRSKATATASAARCTPWCRVRLPTRAAAAFTRVMATSSSTKRPSHAA